MKQNSRRMAVCGLLAALSLVLMALGSALAVMTYVCPMLVGVLMLTVREELGTKWSLTLWAAVGLLSLVLVPEVEMAAVFIGIVGWYPSAKPVLDRLPKALSWAAKLAVFNGSAVLVYGLLIRFMGLSDMPEGLWGWGVLLVLGNVVFLLYDLMLDRLRFTLVPRLRRLFPR